MQPLLGFNTFSRCYESIHSHFLIHLAAFQAMLLFQKTFLLPWPFAHMVKLA